ncbi:MAG: FkbM family methyltransferase [Hyphomicrobium sp.]
MLDRTMTGGLSFWIPARDDGVGSSLRRAGEFARPEVDLLLALHESRTDLGFVDVGANIGAIALPFSARSPETPVIACEAHPALHAILCANVIANGLARISALNCAVSDREGIARFPAPPIDSARNFGATGFSSAGDETAPVMMTTLDTLTQHRPIGTLKIDVEGHEAKVLSGASETIARDRPAVLFEAKTGAATTANTDWFLSRGYALYWFFAPFITP